MDSGEGGSGSGRKTCNMNKVYERLKSEIEDDVNPELLREQLERLPSSYVDKVEDASLLHLKLLIQAKDPDKRPAYDVRVLKNFHTKDVNDDEGILPSGRREVASAQTEVIFSTIDKPKHFRQFSALLSDMGLNIHGVRMFSTTDGYSLDVFVVDGWSVEDQKEMLEELEKAIARSELSVEAISAQAKLEDWEIDRKLLNKDEKIATGSSCVLHRALYRGLDVAVKILKSEHSNNSLEVEFDREVDILSRVQHKNVVRFIGVCSKPPLHIVTEYMPGGSLYDHLRKQNNTLELSQVLRFAIDVCKGMEYLHQNNIIHRDLKSANLLLDKDMVVKVADFGVSRFLSSEGGGMTPEKGTIKWMAPEVMASNSYDQKADVFSFGIVLWELATAKVPYGTMGAIQVGFNVKALGLRPELPPDLHPKLVELMQGCWEEAPSDRPSFSEITPQLEELLKDVEDD